MLVLGRAATLLAFLFVVLSANPTLSQDLKKGYEAWVSGDFSTAFSELHPLALDGNADAQYIIGYMYVLGEGVSRDLYRVEDWLRSAATKGHHKAQYTYALVNFELKRYKVAALWINIAETTGTLSEKGKTAKIMIEMFIEEEDRELIRSVVYECVTQKLPRCIPE